MECWLLTHRLLVLLTSVDSLHLISSLLSFSVPSLFPLFLSHTYRHSLPYTLPIAQVKTGLSFDAIYVSLP